MYYVLYLLAWLFGISRRGDAVVKTRKAGIRISIVSLLILALFFAVVSGIQMGALIFAALPIFIIFPAICLGLGLSVSTIARSLWLKNSTFFAIAMAVVSLIGPTLAVVIFSYNRHIQQTQRLEDLAAFQQGTIEGQIEDQLVRFPASPQLETIHACETLHRCYTEFHRHGGTLQDLIVDPEAGVRFLEITLFPVHGTCDGPNAPRNSCLTQPMLQAWCETRDSLLQTIWCEGRPRHRLVFAPVDGAPLHRLEERNWSTAATGSVGMDYVGDPIEIECSTGRDTTILSNPHRSRYCRIRFNIADNVVATAFLDNFGSSEMISEAATMLDYANEIWASMSLH